MLSSSCVSCAHNVRRRFCATRSSRAHNAAADAWKQYLAASDLQDFEAAKIWYRIGTTYKSGGAHERALDAFYRSESLHQSGELAAMSEY